MKKYIHFIVLIIFCSLIALSILGAYFLYQKAKTALDTQQRMKLEQEIQAERIQNLPDLALRYQKIVEAEPLFSLLYPEDRVVEVIKDIERLAKEHQVTLTITQKEVVEPKKVPVKKEDVVSGEAAKPVAASKELVDTLPYEKRIRLELKAKGQYRDLRDFLRALETAPYALDVLSLDTVLAPLEEEEGQVVQTVGGNPFLLSSPTLDAATAVNSSDIIFLLDIALYLK